MTKRGNDAVHRGAIVIGYLLTCHALVQVHIANVRPCGAGDIVHFNQLQIAPMMGIHMQTDSAKPKMRALRARRACSGVMGFAPYCSESRNRLYQRREPSLIDLPVFRQDSREC